LRSFHDLSAECSGELVIGASDHISIHRLPDVLKSYITEYPKVDLKLRCHRSETVLEMLRHNAVDLGVITLPPPAANLVTKVIWPDPMSLVAPKGHPLGALRTVTLRDVSAYSMILPEQGTTTRNAIDAAFSGKRLSPRVTMEVAYIETIKGLVKAGLAVSVLPDKAVEGEVRAGSLIRLAVADARFARRLGAVYLREKFLSRPAREFLKLLEATAG